MAKFITEADIKPALKFATGSTKKLVTAGVNAEDKNGEDKFPELLSKYKWSGTRDYNMAMIIIAFYAYCAQQEDADLKKFGMSARYDQSNKSVFEFLEDGKGVDIVLALQKKGFNNVMDKVLQKIDALKDLENNSKTKERANITANFLKQVKKITPWKINQGDVHTCIVNLTNKIQNQNEKIQNEKTDAAIKEKNTVIKETEKTKAELKKLKAYYDEKLKSLNNDINNLKTELETTKSTNQSELDKKAKEITNLNDKMQKLNEEYHTKVSTLIKQNSVLQTNQTNIDLKLKDALIKDLNSYIGKEEFTKKIENSNAKIKELEEKLINTSKNISSSEYLLSKLQSFLYTPSIYHKLDNFKTALEKLLAHESFKDFKQAHQFPSGKFNETLSNNLENYLSQLKSYIRSTLGQATRVEDPKPVLISGAGSSKITNLLGGGAWRQIYFNDNIPEDEIGNLAGTIETRGYCGNYRLPDDKNGYWYYDKNHKNVCDLFTNHGYIVITED